MLTITFSIMGMIMTSLLSSSKKIWSKMMTQTSILFLSSSMFLMKKKSKIKKKISNILKTDWLSSPLMILSLWLTPVSLLASMGHLKKKPKSKIQEFMFLMLIMLLALMMTFSTKDLMIFFLSFESTLMPTLLLITRWGMKQERMEAGYYFVFYTLMSSLPLFISLLSLYNINKHSCMPLKMLEDKKASKKMLPLFCLMAFLVKVPMFSLHLWLPKAHVEAPVAGSMMLAAMLLKMGGYGFIRLTSMFWLSFLKNLSPLLMPFCCWGGLLTSMICLSQTDLKSLMAYSSVSHMSFMMASLSLLTNWAMVGGIMMMVAHGIVSSALFAMANMMYERKKTRTLKMKRGLKKSLSILPKMWLMFACAKLGLPPFPKAISELLMFSTIMKYKMMKIMLMALSMTFTAMFSLSIYQLINSGNNFKWNSFSWKMKEREFLMIILHLLPLMSLITKPNLMSIWST